MARNAPSPVRRGGGSDARIRAGAAAFPGRARAKKGKARDARSPREVSALRPGLALDVADRLRPHLEALHRNRAAAVDANAVAALIHPAERFLDLAQLAHVGEAFAHGELAHLHVGCDIRLVL